MLTNIQRCLFCVLVSAGWGNAAIIGVSGYVTASYSTGNGAILYCNQQIYAPGTVTCSEGNAPVPYAFATASVEPFSIDAVAYAEGGISGAVVSFYEHDYYTLPANGPITARYSFEVDEDYGARDWAASLQVAGIDIALPRNGINTLSATFDYQQGSVFDQIVSMSAEDESIAGDMTHFALLPIGFFDASGNQLTPTASSSEPTACALVLLGICAMAARSAF